MMYASFMNIPPSSPTDISVDQLKRDWEQLHPLDRAKAISSLKKSGLSNRQIARQIGRGESTLRHLLLALRAPAADLISARQQNLSTNELVRRAKADAVRRTALRKSNLETNRKEHALAGSQTICEWVGQHWRSGPSGEQIVKEARRRMIESSLDGNLPKVDLPDHPFAPAITIERCKPQETLEDSGTDIGWYGRWPARWIIFVFPDLYVADEALQKAEQEPWRL